LEAVVDPFEPPLPAKITMEQARHFAESLARGQPNRVEIAWSVLEGKVKEMI
jgi:pyruvate dehydrogenase (quinone)/pyruvate oxidase